MADSIQKIISEEIERFVLNEMLSSKCYHFTTLDGLFRILKTNTFLLKTDVVSDTEHWADKPRQRFFMSTTRVRDGRFGYNNFINKDNMLVRITLNGDLLNANYRGKPINWKTHSEKVQGDVPNLRSAESSKSKSMSPSRYNTELTQIQPFVENEDRIYSNKPSIPNADRYIERIDILTYNSYKDVNAQAMDILEEIPSRFRNITYVYTTMKDFNRQSNNMDNVDRSKVKDTENPRVDVNLSQDDLVRIDFYAENIYNFLSICDKIFEMYRKKEYGYNLEDLCFHLGSLRYIMLIIKDLNTTYYNNDKSKQIIKNTSDWFVKHNIVNFNELRNKIDKIREDNKSRLKG